MTGSEFVSPAHHGVMAGYEHIHLHVRQRSRTASAHRGSQERPHGRRRGRGTLMRFPAHRLPLASGGHFGGSQRPHPRQPRQTECAGGPEEGAEPHHPDRQKDISRLHRRAHHGKARGGTWHRPRSQDGRRHPPGVRDLGIAHGPQDREDEIGPSLLAGETEPSWRHGPVRRLVP